jgi:hypothetical protein
MSDERRKVLNLLEFCVELDPDCFSVYEMIRGVAGGIPLGRDLSDVEMAALLEGYAWRLTRQQARRWKHESSV